MTLQPPPGPPPPAPPMPRGQLATALFGLADNCTKKATAAVDAADACDKDAALAAKNWASAALSATQAWRTASEGRR